MQNSTRRSCARLHRETSEPGDVPVIADVMARLRAAGLGHIPVMVGGIIPDEDAEKLKSFGVARVYTPKDFELNNIMMDVVSLADPKEFAAQ